MKNEPIRIQKYISDCGAMSRRAAEEQIRAGKIAVNGAPASIGQKIMPEDDVVTFNGAVIQPSSDRKTYIMLNKPSGYITTLSDEFERRCITELIKDVGCRVYPCGRLDMESEGLLILTDDGALANKLTHPGHDMAKIYNVRLSAEITDGELSALNRPMEIDGYKIRPAKATIISRSGGYTNLRFELREGRNRQIRKMCEKVGVEVTKLRRVAIGAIELGDLPRGKWRRLTATEVKYLKNA